MTVKYHVNDKGEPGVCNAVHKCRFNASEEEHYDTPQEARAGYEKKMVEEIVPEGINKSTKLSASKLNKVAKFTDDQEILLDAAQRGSSRVRASVLSNHNSGGEVLRELYKTSTPNSEEAKAIVKHKNYPVEDLTTGQIIPVMRQYWAGGTERTKIAADDSINDEKSARISEFVKGDIKVLSAMAFNENNQISKNQRTKMIDSNKPLIAEAVNRGFYSPENVSRLDDNTLRNQLYYNFENLKDQKVIDAYVDEAIDRSSDVSNWEKIRKNPQLSSRTINKIVSSGAAGSSVEGFYYHKNTSPTTKAELQEAFPRLASIGKAQRATGKDSIKDIKDDLIVKSETKNIGTSYYADRIQLDKDKLSKYGLNKNDVEALFSGGYNAGAVYNPETGEFTGKTDSSG